MNTKKQLGRLAAAVGMAAAAFAVAATVSAAPAVAAPESVAVPRAGLVAAPTARISRAQAEQIALRRFPGTRVVSSELSNRGALWEVRLSNGAEVKVNAQTGAVVKVETAAGNGAGGVISGTLAISQAQAEQIALRLFPGAQVVSSELSNRGTLWEVRLSNGAEVKVNPQTGAVVKAETAAANGVISGTAMVSRQQAEQAALRYFPGATVVKSELEDGRWEVKLSNGGQVKINAVNGALIKLELKETQAARSDDSGRGGSDNSSDDSSDDNDDNRSDDSGRGGSDNSSDNSSDDNDDNRSDDSGRGGSDDSNDNQPDDSGRGGSDD